MNWRIFQEIVEVSFPFEIDRVLVLVRSSLVANRFRLDLEVREFVIYETEGLIVFILESRWCLPKLEHVLVEVVRFQRQVLLLRQLDPLLEILQPTFDEAALDKLLLAKVFAEIEDGLLGFFLAEVEVRVHDAFANETRVPIRLALLVDIFDAPKEIDVESLIAAAVEFLIEGIHCSLNWVVIGDELLLLRQRANLRSIVRSNNCPNRKDEYDHEAELPNLLVPGTAEEFVKFAFFFFLDGFTINITN